MKAGTTEQLQSYVAELIAAVGQVQHTGQIYNGLVGHFGYNAGGF